MPLGLVSIDSKLRNNDDEAASERSNGPKAATGCSPLSA
jgi:hypothetical protein